MNYSRVVLFGAGASFGSPAVLPVPPPLSADLYRVLAKAFPDSWGGVSDELQLKFEDHFETDMGALWDMYPAAVSPLIPGAPSPHRLMQDMARLFMSYHLAPGGHDLYTRFMIELRNASKGKDTSLSTLNYEHLAEQAMEKLDLKPQILRPHGGCRFWPRRGGHLFGFGRAVGQGMHSVSSRIRLLPCNAIQRQLNKPGQSQYPCMAMYLEGKVTQMGQRYLWRAQDRFARRVLSANTVTLIGVRPWPPDTHIWQPIFETKATVLYVGGENDFKVLRKCRPDDRESVFVADRFEECIGDLVKRM
jgi:hypothetical protein